MKSKSFIKTVDNSLLTPEERKLKRIFKENPELTLEEAFAVLQTGKPIKKEEPKPKLEKEVKPVKKAKTVSETPKKKTTKK